MTSERQISSDRQSDMTERDLESSYRRKDLKAQRAVTKETLFDGSRKLKHSVPKGKRV